jgi:hypothetical protein
MKVILHLSHTHHNHSIGYPYTCPLISSHHIGSGAFCNWAPIMALTPPEVSQPVVMVRSELGLISWPSHLQYEVSPLVVMGRFMLWLISWPSHFPSEVYLPVIMQRSKPGLILWPSHLLSEVSPLVIMGRFILGIISWPSHLLSEVSLPVVMGRSYPPSSGITLVALRFSTRGDHFRFRSVFIKKK